MKLPTTRDGKPVLDEGTFQKLLAAAYVLQEHRERVQAAEQATRTPADSDPHYAHTLAEIVETQQQILMRHLDLEGASDYVVQQVQRITSSAGAAVGLLDHDHLVYRAVSGLSASEIGSALPKQRALSSAVLTEGMVLRCPNARLESQVDQELVNRRAIGSFVAVPIFHDDQVAGVLELLFDRRNGFTDYDVHTCQMMAGLVTEALARTDDEKWKRSLAAERDSMLQALEKLKPQLDRLAKDAEMLSASAVPNVIRSGPASVPPSPVFTKRPAVRSSPARQNQRSSVGEAECHKCGNPLGEQEVYCGSCGSLRSERPANGRQGAEIEYPVPEGPEPESEAPHLDAAQRIAHQQIELPPEVLALVNQETTPEPAPDIADELLKLLPPEDWEGHAAPKAVTPATSYPWTSAAHARAWLNSMSDPKAAPGLLDFLRLHRGDVSLVGAILLVLVAIFWSRTDHASVPTNPTITTSANSSSTPASSRGEESETEPQPQISFWDRTLIALGLADTPVVPPRPQPTGNPEVSVWVDLHTALYYCPGTDLYGKTPNGRFATQRQAQGDRFEPASGKVCE
jgi:GAF domain-containing protein